MTAVSERPVASLGSPEEWLVELYQTSDLKDSTSFIEEMRAERQKRLAKERLAQQKEREAREAEEAFQQAHRDEIWLENQYEREALIEQSCKQCFCIHPGECL